MGASGRSSAPAPTGRATPSTHTGPAPSSGRDVLAAGEVAVLDLLTGHAAREVLDVVLGTAGVAVDRHEVHNVQHRPGDGVTVGYRVWVRDAGAAAPTARSSPGADAGRDAPALVEEYVLISSTAGRDVPDDAPGLVRLDGPDGRLLAWRHPQDPTLPALGTGCDPAALAPLLPGDGPVTELDLVGYRPLRRAVLRVVRGGDTAFVKVLRPASVRGGAADVVRRHALLADAGVPVPRVLTSTPDGIVVLERAAGAPLVDAIAADDAAGLELDDLVAVLDALPAGVADLPRRPAWSDRARAYADAVAAAAGPDARRARAVARAVRDRSARADLGPVVPTHGDFHEGQLTVRRRPSGRGWRVAGLLDVDTAGPGLRVDDLACLVAHALALGPAGEAVATRWEARAREVVDPAALAVRTAGVLLSLAAGAVHADEATVGAAALLDAAEDRLGEW